MKSNGGFRSHGPRWPSSSWPCWLDGRQLLFLILLISTITLVHVILSEDTILTAQNGMTSNRRPGLGVSLANRGQASVSDANLTAMKHRCTKGVSFITAKLSGQSKIMSENKADANATDCQISVAVVNHSHKEVTEAADIVIDLPAQIVQADKLGMATLMPVPDLYQPSTRHTLVQLTEMFGIKDESAGKPVFPLERTHLYTYYSQNKAITDSVFAVISGEIACDQGSLLTAMINCFMSGCIPVVSLCSSKEHLPYARVVDWPKAAILADKDNLDVILRSLAHLDEKEIFELRRIGWLIYDRYFSSFEVFVDFAVAAVRDQVGLQPQYHHTEEVEILTLYGETPEMIDEEFQPVTDRELYFMWNTAFYPWSRAPNLRHILTQFDRRGEAELGPPDPKEQFTLLTMTYELLRQEKLKELFNMFKGIAQLKAIVLVWNDLERSPTDANLSNPGVPIHIVKSTVNSLNNRFIPYRVIQTEAVVSLDDDARGSSKEDILHAFELWQKYRMSFVGYTARDMKNDDGKFYYVSHKPNAAMLLPKLIFHHKYYLYRYTYELPAFLRDMVQETFNCEDIYFNALSQELTGQPVIMAGHHKESGCGNCGSGLQGRGQPKHYAYRSACVGEHLIKAFGYVPLIRRKTAIIDLKN